MDDILIVSNKLDTLNVAYPLSVVKWEIYRMPDFNRNYAKIYFKKLSGNVAFAEAVIQYKRIFDKPENRQTMTATIADIDTKPYEFFEIIRLEDDARITNIVIGQCALKDGSLVAEREPIEVDDRFFPLFGKYRTGITRLMKGAIGYPKECGTHWFCACGALNGAEAKTCAKCGAGKDWVFSKITQQAVALSVKRIEEEAAYKRRQTDERDESSKKRALVFGLVFFAVFVMCIILLVLTVNC